MIQTQTFDFQDRREELAAIALAVDLIGKKQYDEASRVLIHRHDQLTAQPKLKLYGT